MKETLAKLKKGERGIISALECAAGQCRRMTSLGLQKGKEVEIVSRHPWRGPIVIKIGNLDLAIGWGLAQHVIVEH